MLGRNRDVGEEFWVWGVGEKSVAFGKNWDVEGGTQEGGKESARVARTSRCRKGIRGVGERSGVLGSNMGRRMRRNQGVGEDQGHPGEELSAEGGTEQGARRHHERGGGGRRWCAAGREPEGGTAASPAQPSRRSSPRHLPGIPLHRWSARGGGWRPGRPGDGARGWPGAEGARAAPPTPAPPLRPPLPRPAGSQAGR